MIQMINDDFPNLFICGKRGFGKSTYSKEIIKQLQKEKKYIIFVIDINAEYNGDYIITDIDRFYDDFPEIDDFKKGKVYVFRFSQNLEDYEEVIAEIHSEFRDSYLVIDESNLIMSSYYIPDDLKNLIALGRHKNNKYCVISRRPAEISRFATAQVDRIIAFRTTEPRDLEYLKKLGFDDEKLKTLKKPVFKNNKLISLDYLEINELENDETS